MRVFRSPRDGDQFVLSAWPFRYQSGRLRDSHKKIIFTMRATLSLLLATGANAYSLGAVGGAARHPQVCMAADGTLKVGVLAIQGGFAEHMQALGRQTGVEAVEVRTPFELLDCDALILPGGESTAIGHGLEDAKMLDDIKEFCATKPVSARLGHASRRRARGRPSRCAASFLRLLARPRRPARGFGRRFCPCPRVFMIQLSSAP